MTNASLIPEQGIRVGLNTAYLVTDQIVENTQYANEWAAKTDGLVRNTDYSAKAYAIGGTGTETNNALYYKNQASASATSASTSATNANNAMTSAQASATSAQASATSAEQYAQDTKGFAPIGSLLPLNCTADYIPDGCLPCDGYEYTKAQFPALWTNYLTSSPVKLQTCTYAEYATSIATYGQCGKFAVDTTNNTFKVPTIKDGAYLTQAKTDAELGKAYNESLPNISGAVAFSQGPIYAADNPNSALYGTNINTVNQPAQTTPGDKYESLHLDASRSSSTYQDGAKVQGDNIRTRFFVVVANAQINQSQMDWSAWATSLAGKMNTDLSNVTATGKETVVGWGMPDYSAGVSMTSPWTAPFDAECHISTTQAGGEIGTVSVNNYFISGAVAEYNQRTQGTFSITVKKGDVVTGGYWNTNYSNAFPIIGGNK